MLPSSIPKEGFQENLSTKKRRSKAGEDKTERREGRSDKEDAGQPVKEED